VSGSDIARDAGLLPLQVQVPFTQRILRRRRRHGRCCWLSFARAAEDTRASPGPNPSDPIKIIANAFSDPAGMKALLGANRE
jgi:hypothetical protein